MASYSKKSRSKDPSYKRNKSNAPDTQLTYPVQRVTPVGGGTSAIIEASKLLSGYQHRLYRQCGNYRMKINLLNQADQAGVRVVTLANTWFVKRSIQTARDMHDLAMEDERAMGKQARWYDFRIQPHSSTVSAYEAVHPAIGTAPGGTAAIVPGGEHQYSIVRDTAGNDRVFTLQGATGTSQYNIFGEYDNTANTARDPVSGLGTGAYDELDGTVEEENLVQLSNRGNEPPYNSTSHPTGLFVEHRTLFRAGGNQVTSTGFFDAPLGMVWIIFNQGDNPSIAVEFAPGNYKGVRMEAY